MAYKEKTIREVMEEINRRQMYLPAIQRKYVWDDDRTMRLFDSIMRGYPIGTFLFWRVKKEVVNQKEYRMYEFIKDFHERDLYQNPAAPQPFIANGEEKIWAVLDGQQRLTSMYIALQGSMRRKLPNKQWKNNDAFPMKELYFNLHSKAEDEESTAYEFRFLTAEEATKTENNALWYLVKNILRYSQKDLIKEVIVKNHWIDDDLAMDHISLLHARLTGDKMINYFEVEADSIDNVLDIFVRVNSGGLVLSKTDLLFSTIVSHWEQARDEIDRLLDDINRTGEGYKFTNDFIMRVCLYVLDMSVTLKVEVFKKDRVQEIQKNWPQIKAAVLDCVRLFDEFGFHAGNILSYVALIPVVYYRFKGGQLDQEIKLELRKYIVMAQIKQIFGAATNTALSSIRDVLKTKGAKPFQLSDLTSIRFTGGRSLACTAEEIDGWFDTFEMNAYTFLILSLLYPNLKYGEKGFHQDHMHPHTAFEGKKLDSVVLPDGTPMNAEKKADWQRRRNTLANLQLLEGRENERKQASPLIDWLKVEANRENAKYLPTNVSYELSHFEEFMEQRKRLMSAELKRILL